MFSETFSICSMTGGIGHAGDAFEAERRVWVFLRLRGEDLADGDVVNRQPRRRDGLLHAVRGETDNRTFAEQHARGLRRHVILSQMHAVRAYGERDVRAVVDDEPHAARASDLQRAFRLAVELTRRKMFLA